MRHPARKTKNPAKSHVRGREKREGSEGALSVSETRKSNRSAPKWTTQKQGTRLGGLASTKGPRTGPYRQNTVPPKKRLHPPPSRIRLGEPASEKGNQSKRSRAIVRRRNKVGRASRENQKKKVGKKSPPGAGRVWEKLGNPNALLPKGKKSKPRSFNQSKKKNKKEKNTKTPRSRTR